MEALIRSLGFDSSLFGVSVGTSDLVPEQQDWTSIIEAGRRDRYRLIYVNSSQRPPGDLNGAVIGAVVTRVEYLRPLSQTAPVSLKNTVSQVRDGAVREELRELCYLSGQFSRFRVDPYLPADGFVSLYNLWLDRSLSGEIATAVFVAGEPVPQGMITVQTNTGKEASIGLLAVSPSAQGRGLGRSLIEQAQQFAFAAGAASLRVPTQAENLAACRFYESCGFHADHTIVQTHLWIEAPKKE